MESLLRIRDRVSITENSKQIVSEKRIKKNSNDDYKWSDRPVVYHLSMDLLTFACMESSFTSLILEITKFVNCQLTLGPLPLLLVPHQGQLDTWTVGHSALSWSMIWMESLLILCVRIVLYLWLFSKINFIVNNLLSNLYTLFICIEITDYYWKGQGMCVHFCKCLFIWLFYSIF
jgi:hypothetical protein